MSATLTPITLSAPSSCTVVFVEPMLGFHLNFGCTYRTPLTLYIPMYLPRNPLRRYTSLFRRTKQCFIYTAYEAPYNALTRKVLASDRSGKVYKGKPVVTKMGSTWSRWAQDVQPFLGRWTRTMTKMAPRWMCQAPSLEPLWVHVGRWAVGHPYTANQGFWVVTAQPT